MIINKFITAVNILKPNTELVYGGDITNEEEFNKVMWVTGKDENNQAITTTTNPHSELTWTKVKAEMDKL
tara:strand:+ start:463 stop:672 length:210 start_codon:yes stop_codon:yes gene_type:complete